MITLRRVIYQSMQLSFQRGRLVTNPFAQAFEFGPNLEIIPKVNFAYEQAAGEDEKNRDHIERAHRNFLRDAVYFLYEYNRLADAAQWYKYLSTKYPDKTLLDGKTNSLPANMTLDQYAVARVQGDVSESGGHDRTEGVVEGLLVNSYRSMAMGEDGPAAGFRLLAQQVWSAYQRTMPKNGSELLACVPLRILIGKCGGACSIHGRASRRKCARYCAPNWASRPKPAPRRLRRMRRRKRSRPGKPESRSARLRPQIKLPAPPLAPFPSVSRSEAGLCAGQVGRRGPDESLSVGGQRVRGEICADEIVRQELAS